MAFNPNELILERVRSVEEYDPATDELIGRYTQIEDPSLQTSADGTDVTDAMGAPIMTFYRNQQATFSFSNSLHSLDLFASQFGSEKKVADEGAPIQIPVTETLAIGGESATPTVTLKYTPVDGSLKYVKIVNTNKTFGDTYTLDTAADAEQKHFSLSDTTITLPENTTGRVLVSYIRESTAAASVVKTSDSLPAMRKLWIHVIFRDPCNQNLKYAGVIVAENAQIDPSSVEVALTSDGKHAASYLIRAPYCNEEESKLFEILVSEE